MSKITFPRVEKPFDSVEKANKRIDLIIKPKRPRGYKHNVLISDIKKKIHFDDLI